MSDEADWDSLESELDAQDWNATLAGLDPGEMLTKLLETCASIRVGVNSIPELELKLNSNSNSGIGIGIEIGGIENGIGIENPGIGIGIGIENWNWIFCNCYRSNN